MLVLYFGIYQRSNVKSSSILHVYHPLRGHVLEGRDIATASLSNQASTPCWLLGGEDLTKIRIWQYGVEDEGRVFNLHECPHHPFCLGLACSVHCPTSVVFIGWRLPRCFESLNVPISVLTFSSTLGFGSKMAVDEDV